MEGRQGLVEHRPDPLVDRRQSLLEEGEAVGRGGRGGRGRVVGRGLVARILIDLDRCWRLARRVEVAEDLADRTRLLGGS